MTLYRVRKNDVYLSGHVADARAACPHGEPTYIARTSDAAVLGEAEAQLEVANHGGVLERVDACRCGAAKVACPTCSEPLCAECDAETHRQPCDEPRSYYA